MAVRFQQRSDPARDATAVAVVVVIVFIVEAATVAVRRTRKQIGVRCRACREWIVLVR